MPNEKPRHNPQAGTYLRNAVRDELFTLLSFFRFHWVMVLVLVASLAAVAYLANPFPPHRVTLGTGQADTTFDVLGKRYVEYFRKHGVELVLRGTTGTLENLSLLRQGKIDAAYSTRGVTTAEDNQSLLSLGSVGYSPLWFFHHGAAFEESPVGPAGFLKKMVVSINLPASGTYVFAHRILSLHGLTPDESPNILHLSSKDSVEAYLAGAIDGVFLLGTLDSKSITTLLAAPNTTTFNFTLAPAYVRKFPDLGIVSVPRGAINAQEALVVPTRDVQMIAPSATILTDERLHPAIQLLLLNAAKQFDQSIPSLLSTTGTFPAYLDRATPLSDVAKRYYENGPPFLAERAPYWVASLVDRIWLYVLALAVFGYPLRRLIPNARTAYAELCLKTSYAELHDIDVRLNQTPSAAELAVLLEALDGLELKIRGLWVTPSMRQDHFEQRQKLDWVRTKVKTRLVLVSQPVAPH